MKHLFNSSFLYFFITYFFSQYITLFCNNILTDDFTGTTIDPVKWNETDAGGVGGTTGNIQQNGSLTMTGSAAWGTNYVVTDTTYNRSLTGLEMEADVTCASGSSIMGIGYVTRSSCWRWGIVYYVCS